MSEKKYPVVCENCKRIYDYVGGYDAMVDPKYSVDDCEIITNKEVEKCHLCSK